MKEYSDHDIAMMDNWSALREAKNLSLEDISSQTNIPVKKLAAIENHEFDNLGNETFVLGYIRSYAKYLGVNADVLIQVYRDAVSPDEALLAQTQGMRAVDPIKQLLQKVNVLQLSIGIIVLWIVAMLFIGGGDDEAEDYSPSSVDEYSTQDSAIGSGDNIIAAEATEIEGSTQELKHALASVDPEPAVSPSSELEQVLEVSEDSVSGDSAAPVEEAVDTAAVEVDQYTAQPKPDIGSGDDLIVLTFTDECWLEVTDASGKVLIAELQRKGDNQRIFGQAPFKIMLGNARATTLTLNGEVVSTKPPVGRKTLRFTVPR